MNRPQNPSNPTSSADPLAVPMLPSNNFGSAERGERSDAAANRRRILQVAEKLFAKKGVSEVNMADIARAAGVGQGTLYRRFANKSELCLALMDTQMFDFQNSVIAQLGKMSRMQAPKLQQLAWFLDALVAFNAKHQPLLCIAQGAVHNIVTEGVWRGRPAPWVWQHMTVRGLLQSAIVTKEVPPPVASMLDIAFFTNLLLAPLQPENFRTAREVDGFDLSRISAGLQQAVALLRGK